MRNAGRELAHRFEFLRLAQLFLQAFTPRNVGPGDDESGRAARSSDRLHPKAKKPRVVSALKRQVFIGEEGGGGQLSGYFAPQVRARPLDSTAVQGPANYVRSVDSEGGYRCGIPAGYTPGGIQSNQD